MTRELSEMSSKEIEKALRERKQWKADMIRRIGTNFCDELLLKYPKINTAHFIDLTEEIISKMWDYL